VLQLRIDRPTNLQELLDQILVYNRDNHCLKYFARHFIDLTGPFLLSLQVTLNKIKKAKPVCPPALKNEILKRFEI